LGDARHLALRALEHEHQLVALVNRLEGRSPATTDSHIDQPYRGPSSHAHSSGDAEPTLLLLIRQLCVEAREQRIHAEALALKLSESTLDLTKPLSDGRILVVDDSEDTRELIAAAVASAGLEVHTAANGLDAVLAAHNLRPAVLLMDINMPVLDGIEATRLLRASTATRGSRVIAHTAKPDFFEGPMTRLFDDVLPKPVAPDVVVARVRRFVT
jgi:CheY-like chemotaxis protein